MNQWRKQYEDHPLHTELATIDNLLNSAKLKTIDESILSSFDRLITVIKTFELFTSSSIPELTTKIFLDTIYGPVAQIRIQLNNFIETENTAHLQNANNNADTLVQMIPPYTLPEALTQSKEAISSLTIAIDGLIASLTEQARNTSDTLKQLQAGTVASTERLNQLDKTIETQKGRLDTAIAEFQKQFSETEAARSKQATKTEQNINTPI